MTIEGVGDVEEKRRRAVEKSVVVELGSVRLGWGWRRDD